MAPKRRNQGAESSNNMVARNASMAGSKDSLGRDLISSNKRPSSSFENDIPRDPKGRRTGSVTSDDENASDDENDADSIEDQIVNLLTAPRNLLPTLRSHQLHQCHLLHRWYHLYRCHLGAQLIVLR